MSRIKSILSSILFITTGLVMTMDLCCELPKIPNLLAHFSEHQQRDNDSFWEFLMEDYAHQESGHDHHNEEEHDDLPFHGNHTCHHAPIVFTGIVSYSFVPSNLFVDTGNCGYQFSISSTYLETPLQPPQKA
ncbi:MAG: hypothetical protein WBH03_12430 [Cyclobacteriaceae bacterium]